MRWIGLVARLVLGGVWIVAGVLKIGDPAESVRAVRAYDLLPEALVQLVGHGLPVLEIVVGLALVLGLLTRWAALLSALMLLAFVVGISSAWARGLQIECGCFGGGGPTQDATATYPWEIARDVGLLVLAGFLVWRPRTPVSLDERLLPVVAPVAARTAEAGGSGGLRGARTRASQRAAEIRREAAAADQRRRNLVVGLGVAIAVLAVLVVGTGVQAGRDVTGTVSAVPSGTVDTYAFAYGAANPTTVVDVYEDFMCPYCGQFEKLSRSIVQKYADRGVQFRYHVIAFLDRASTTEYSTRAASALGVVLDTTGPAAAKRFHDELYAQQPQEGSAGLSNQQLVRLAVQAGAKASEVEQGIDDRRYAEWAANANDAASKAGVNGTPTVLVDGTKVGGTTVPAIVQTLGQELARATSS